MGYSRIVLANGCFDVFHIGHLLYLQEAATLGDRLVVAVTRDAFVNKGPNRPMFDEVQRAAIIRALRCVDEVILSDDSLDALEAIKPAIFVKGKDYIGGIEKRHSDYCKAHGIEIRFTDQTVYSSTRIINDRLRQS